MHVGLITCDRLPEPDPDRELLRQALVAEGLTAEWIAWDGSAEPMADLLLLRSCWNYYRDLDAFLDWIARQSARIPLLNPASVVRWNASKTYLTELAALGVATVPTRLLRRGADARLSAVMDAEDWPDLVIKPTVSAGSYRTRRFDRTQGDAGQAFLDESLARHDVLLQPYITSVEHVGERSLIWIAGQWTHTIRKSPRFADDAEAITDARPLSDAERALGDAVLAAQRQIDPSPLLYARVDVVQGADGRWLLAELELIEPSLFFREWPAALAPFCAAVGAALRRKSV